MRSIALVCTLAGTASAGHVHGKVARDRVVVPLDVRITIDNEPVHHTHETFDLDVPDGVHIVEIAGPAFITISRTVTVKGAVDLKILDVDSGRRIYGRVTDETGTSVPDATVVAYDGAIVSPYSNEDALLAQGAHVATTFVDGTFAIDGLPDDAVVKVIAFANPAVPTADVRRSVVELVPPRTGAGILVIAESGSIAGHVKDRKKLRTPVVLAKAVVTGPAAPVPILAGVDPTGTFGFADLPAGTYDLTFADETMVPTRIVVTAGHEVKADMAAPHGRGDIAIAAADCSLVTLEAPTDAQLVTALCEDGHALVMDVAFGTYHVCVDGDEPCQDVTVKGKRATVTHVHVADDTAWEDQ